MKREIPEERGVSDALAGIELERSRVYLFLGWNHVMGTVLSAF